MADTPRFAVVAPMLNEAGNIEQMAREIAAVRKTDDAAAVSEIEAVLNNSALKAEKAAADALAEDSIRFQGSSNLIVETGCELNLPAGAACLWKVDDQHVAGVGFEVSDRQGGRCVFNGHTGIS